MTYLSPTVTALERKTSLVIDAPEMAARSSTSTPVHYFVQQTRILPGGGVGHDGHVLAHQPFGVICLAGKARFGDLLVPVLDLGSHPSGEVDVTKSGCIDVAHRHSEKREDIVAGQFSDVIVE